MMHRSDERIARVTAPLLVMHGGRDSTIPIGFGQRLFALAREPKQFVRFDEGGHDDLANYGAIETARSQRPVFLIEFGIEPGRPNSTERLRRFLDAAGYTLFAICRSDPSIFRCEYRFEELEPSRLSSVWTKMLFLAPRKSEFFQELARARPDALARPLRPRNAREFLRDVLR